MKNQTAITHQGHRYETIFCVFLLAAVFLWRDNTHMVYPNILYLFAGLLSFNLAAGWVLKRWPGRADTAAAIVIGNCALITSILSQSGGSDSNLWVLYLLPIYTVCLLLDGFLLVLIVFSIALFNATFHILSADRAVDAAILFNLSVKTGMFFFAAAATWKVAQKDRNSREKLDDNRAEIERMETRLAAQHSTLQESKRMADIGQIASGIAHDIAGPLAVIIGTARMLLEDEGAQAFRKDLERIDRAAKLCETISSNVLNFARSKDVREAPCDLRNIVDAALEIYGPSLAEHSITVEKDFAPDVPTVNGFSAQLERVVMNLVSNAKHAMSQGGHLRIAVEAVSARPYAAPWVQVVVEDTGPGISPEAFAKIFKPFNTTKAKGEGTGLGLYLCRQIAVDHRGRLQVENRSEGGARFVLSLPSTAVFVAESELAAAA